MKLKHVPLMLALILSLPLILQLAAADRQEGDLVPAAAVPDQDPAPFITTTTTTVPPTTTTTTTVPPTTVPPPTTAPPTTVPPPPPTTTEPPPVVTTSTSCGGWEGLISAYFTDAAKACAVMLCESKGNPSALNSNPKYQAAGLFQIIKQWASQFEVVTGVPYYDGRFDPDANTRFAAWLQSQEGWSQWACA